MPISASNKHQQESFLPTSLISLFEYLLQSFDKKTSNQLDGPLFQKLEPNSNNIMPNDENDSNSMKSSTIPATNYLGTILNDYDEEDRKFFEYNLPDYENSDNPYNTHVINKGECETINGTIGECRAPSVCLKREPKRSSFSLCEWSHHRLTGARIPIKLCCEKRQSSTIKDLTNEADVEKQWEKQLALGFGGNGQSSIDSFWNLVSHPMAFQMQNP
ncbi:hypothetical protein BLA29_007041, partial [Euroglyphus maynei]